MASTYALPIDNASPARGHAHSRSHYAVDHLAPWTAQMNSLSPPRAPSHAGSSHRHARSEMNGQSYIQGLSPYGHQYNQSHDHSHSHSRSNESTYTLKPFMNGRPKGRARGESDLGRPAEGNGVARKHAFSPIHEHPAALPSQSSWLELPEALTALLLPLPYVFASLAYSNFESQHRKPPANLADTVGDSTPPSLHIVNGGQLLHACTLSSATLLLVGLISKFRLMGGEPLDRRKAYDGSDKSGKTSNLSAGSLWRTFTHVLGLVLPFYATMQLGGARTALILLAATTAGLGCLDQKPGKQSAWANTLRTLRTRKATYGSLLLALSVHAYSVVDTTGIMLGYIALALSLFAIPPPLPTTGWFLMVGSQNQNGWTTQPSTRAALPKPSSPLVSTPQDTNLTLGAGLILTLLTVLYATFSSAAPSLAHHALLFSTLSIASATASVYLSVPSALRSLNKSGLAIGGLLISAFGQFEHLAWHAFGTFVVILAATVFDTRASALPQPSSHEHPHGDHQHSHSQDHDHHLHGNHSRLSTFIIARCTPGSILHSIMIEKDSRRIAYFGVLNLSFMMVQFFYGYVSGSLGLLTDSIHMLFDCAGLAVGLAAAVMSKWRPNVAFPYGYGKVDTLSGFANGVFLLLVSVEIILDAFERLWEGHELHRLNELLIVSVLGFLVNIVGLTAFGHAHHGHGHSHDHDHGDHSHSHGHSHGHSHDNENMQGIFLHILADALGSVAVIISTLLTKYYGWAGWDPIASCIISALIFASAIPLVKSSGMRLMLSLPADVEYGIRNTLQELSSLRGVVGYAVPKFWIEDEGAAHAEVHAHEHEKCGHDHDRGHSHSHGEHGHDHGHDHSEHNHTHSHGPGGHDHDHSHAHDHMHDHEHAPRGQRILGAIHIIASRAADLEDVRERTAQFLKGKGMDVVLHVEREGEGNCWCGGGNKSN